MSDSSFMADLAAKIRRIGREHIATQTDMAAATGLRQETISKVANGRRSRQSPAMEALDRYADMLLGATDIPPAVGEAVREFLAFGTEEELIASILLCAGLAGRRAGVASRQAPPSSS